MPSRANSSRPRIGPTEHSCIMATLIPAGSATAEQLAGVLNFPVETVQEGLETLHRDGWVAAQDFQGERRYLVLSPEVAAFRKWSRSARRQCEHRRHLPTW